MSNGSKQEFTRGPWAVSLNIFVDDGLFPAVVDHFDLVVCGVLDDGKTVAETVANSRLIAAAPEMYEALKGLVEAVRRDSDEGGEGISGYTGARLTDARAAIAKATGASS